MCVYVCVCVCVCVCYLARFVNCYSAADWVLALLYRWERFAIHVAGVKPVDLGLDPNMCPCLLNAF